MYKFKSTIDDLNGGFAIDYTQAGDAHKKLKAAFVCVDFPNKKAADSKYPDTKFFYDLLCTDGLRVFDIISYGKLDLEIDHYDKWYTMPKNDDVYEMNKGITGERQRAYLKDAMDITCHEIDYSQYDILYVCPVHDAEVPYSPTMVDASRPISCESGEIGLAVTFGRDMYKRKGLLLAHETGHIMGLPDLYTYGVTEGARDAFGHCGTWDLMGWIEGIAPDYIAYSKWRLGWLDDEQFAVAEESGEYQLTPVETAEGLKGVIIPFDEYHGYIVEYRQPLGLDENLPEEAILVYRIDGTIRSGKGCISLIPPQEELYLQIDRDKLDGICRKGETVSRDGISVTSLGGGKIKVTR
ncbi:MAG: hypothetical protein IIV99_03615 [Oscillospiraceae bacterium]|nr:hypothetical protein [Oscillospiraceae bacterium]